MLDDKCPRCGSTDPEQHPAMAHGGEVEICPHRFHGSRVKRPLSELLKIATDDSPPERKAHYEGLREPQPHFPPTAPYVGAKPIHPARDPYAPKEKPMSEAPMQKAADMLRASLPSSDPESFVATELHAKAEIYRTRNALYGDNYKRFGPMFSLMLAGQKLDTSNPDDMNRLGILVQIAAKMTRYGENFNRGGHDDSLDDIAVYSMMLKELDAISAEKRRQREESL